MKNINKRLEDLKISYVLMKNILDYNGKFVSVHIVFILNSKMTMDEIKEVLEKDHKNKNNQTGFYFGEAREDIIFCGAKFHQTSNNYINFSSDNLDSITSNKYTEFEKLKKVILKMNEDKFFQEIKNGEFVLIEEKMLSTHGKFDILLNGK